MPPEIKITVTDKRDLFTLRRALTPLFKGQVRIVESKKVPQGAEEVQGRDAAK